MKKKVLLVSPSGLNNGGVQFVFMTIVRNLSEQFDFDIIVFNDYQNFYKEEFLKYGGNIYHIDFLSSLFGRIIYKFFRRIKIKKNVRKIIKKNIYDVIHCFNQFDSDIFLKRASEVGIKNRICRSGGCYKKEGFITEILRNLKRKRIRKYATSLTGVSKDSCETFYGENSNYLIINNPTNDSIQYSEERPEKLTLLQIGMFTANKNQIFTLNVMSKLLEKCDCNLLLISNYNSPGLSEEIRKRKLDKHVSLFPSDCDKNEVFSKSSFFIFPSLSESFGNVLIEAQNAGVKCFASDTIPRHANCGGVVYLPLNKGPEYWADIIYEEFCKNHGAKQKYDCSRFTTKTFIENINALYLKH